MVCLRTRFYAQKPRTALPRDDNPALWNQPRHGGQRLEVHGIVKRRGLADQPAHAVVGAFEQPMT